MKRVAIRHAGEIFFAPVEHQDRLHAYVTEHVGEARDKGWRVEQINEDLVPVFEADGFKFIDVMPLIKEQNEREWRELEERWSTPETARDHYEYELNARHDYYKEGGFADPDPMLEHDPGPDGVPLEVIAEDLPTEEVVTYYVVYRYPDGKYDIVARSYYKEIADKIAARLTAYDAIEALDQARIRERRFHDEQLGRTVRHKNISPVRRLAVRVIQNYGPDDWELISESAHTDLASAKAEWSRLYESYADAPDIDVMLEPLPPPPPHDCKNHWKEVSADPENGSSELECAVCGRIETVFMTG